MIYQNNVESIGRIKNDNVNLIFMLMFVLESKSICTFLYKNDDFEGRVLVVVKCLFIEIL